MRRNTINERRMSDLFTNRILESVKNKIKGKTAINESEYYPEEDDMMDDYYYGMMMTFSIEGRFDNENLTEETVQALTATSEEYCDNSNSYCSVLVTRVDVQKDEFDDFDITVEAAVSAPEMPIDAIEDDAQDQIWYWFEDKTGLRAINVKIIDEKEVFDNRTEKYKPKGGLNESANTRYKGFKCVNVSDDPSFPVYEIISQYGDVIATTLFPSEMEEIVDNFLYGKKLNESFEYDDYSAISEALAQCGWAFTDAYDVRNRNTGESGVRYIIEPYPNNMEGIKPCGVEEMKRRMTEFIGDGNVIFSEGQHRYAPEIKNLSMVVF